MNPSILLIAVNARYMHASLAVRCLKANLGELEPACSIREYILRTPPEEIADCILESGAKLAGFSVYIWNHRIVLEVLDLLRKSGKPLPVIVVGGPEVSFLDDGAPVIRLADHVVRGEGESAFALLARDILRKDPSVPDSLKGKDAVSGIMPFASFASPYRLYSDIDLSHGRFVYVESSRGCPFACDFCLSSADESLRYTDERTFIAEMRALIGRGAKRFKVLDRTFNTDPERAARIASFFAKELKRDAFVQFEIVPDILPPELMEAFASFPPGTLRLEIGVQTLNPETAELVNRIQDPALILRNIAKLKEATDAVIHADLIAGLPGEDMESFARGFDRLYAVRPGEIQLGILKRLPGTRLARHDGEWEMTYQAEPPYRVLSTGAIDAGNMERLSRFAKFWELAVNRGRFPNETARLLDSAESPFRRFMEFSDYAFARFGRTYGIDSGEIGSCIAAFQAALAEKPGNGHDI